MKTPRLLALAVFATAMTGEIRAGWNPTPPQEGTVTPQAVPPIFAPWEDGSARFVLRDGPVSAFFAEWGLAISAIDPRAAALGYSGWGLHWSPVGAQATSPHPEGRLPGQVHHFVGKESKRNLPTYSRVVYPQIYRGIDLVVESRVHGIEYSLHARPGADLRSIRFLYRGAQDLRVTEDGGGLEVTTGLGILREAGLSCHQEDATGARTAVSAQFASVRAEGDLAWSYSIELGTLDPSLPVVLDPTISWGSYLGGAADDTSSKSAIDSSGNVYLTGTTLSANFPTTPGAFQTGASAVEDVFVTKFAANGTSLAWSTYFGGSGKDYGSGIAIDGVGNVYVTGTTYSSNFPTLSPFQALLWAADDAFVAQFSPGGNLVWSSYLGGGSTDDGVNITVDASGAVYVVGRTNSPTFPHTPGVFQGVKGNKWDAFVTKIAPGGSGIVWSSFLGGSGDDLGYGIAVDAGSNVFVTGQTESSTNFPGTAGGYGGGSYDGYLTKIDSSGVSIWWSQYVGGSQVDASYAIRLGPDGSIYLGGRTTSPNFPNTGGFQPSLGGTYDGFLAKYDLNGVLVWSSYLGGSLDDFVFSLALDPAGNVYAVGYTSSTNFPATGGFQTTLAGGTDAFVTKVNPQGNQILMSSYLGGTGTDYGYGIHVLGGATGNQVFVTGTTTSTDLTLAGGFQATAGGGVDVYVVKIFDEFPPALGLSPVSLAFQGVAGGPAPEGQTVQISNTGGGTLPWSATVGATWLAVTPGVGSAMAGTPNLLTVTVDVSSLAAGEYKGEITMSAAGASHTIPVTLTVTQNSVGAPPGEGGGSQGGSCSASTCGLGISPFLGALALLLTLLIRGRPEPTEIR